MDDTDNDLSDGELGSEAEEDSGGLVRLPCDQPWWPEVSQVLAQLASSTHIEATVTSVGKLAEIVHGEGPGDALRHFLEAECGEEERGWVVAAILPAMASLAHSSKLASRVPCVASRRSASSGENGASSIRSAV